MSDSLAKKKKEKRDVRLLDDIIFEILVRLPTNSLLKFRAVCKSWNSLIKGSTFIHTHLKFQSTNKKKEEEDDLLLYAGRKVEYQSKGEFFMLYCDDINDEYTKRRVIPTCDIEATYGGRKIKFDQHNIHPIGTCNGLILLVCGTNDDVGVVTPIIWNPCVRKFLVLPSPSVSPYKHRFMIFDLGYDPHGNDYKIFQLVVPRYGDYHMPCTFQVFSLLRGSWKNLNAPADFKPFYTDLSAVEISGTWHWISGEHYNQTNEDTVIVTFNMSSELFGKMNIPQALKTDSLRDYCVQSKYRESLALLFRRGSQIKGYYELWVMKEYGLAESWTKLSTIHIPHSLSKVSIYFRNSGELVLGVYRYGVQSLDPKSKQVKNIVDDRFLLSFMDPFVERLVLLDRSDAFSY